MSRGNIKHTVLIFIFTVFTSNAQVGVGTTTPQSTLDIEASDETNPANNDGILIPRMSNFPANPGATRDGMLIFYTGTGAEGKGFYYWDQSVLNWIKIAVGNSDDADWFEAGTTASPNSISDNIYTRGKVTIGSSSIADGTVQINNNLAVENEALVINNTGFRPSGRGYGIQNSFSNSRATSSDLIGLNNQFANLNGTLFTYGVHNDFGSVQNATNIIGVGNRFSGNNPNVTRRTGFNTSILGGNITTIGVRTTANPNYTINAPIYGMDNSIGALGSGDRYGVSNFIYGSGSGTKYGTRNIIDEVAGGIHYGIYSEVQKSNSYAGYFLGRMSLGVNTSNRYLMPAAAGTNNQVMAMSAGGQVNFVNASSVFTDTDNQTIDNFSLSGNTLRLSLEDDGQPLQTVDLSSLSDNTTASNGLNEVGSDIRLGGALTQNTIITQGTRSFDINLNSSGDFAIQDAGTDVFFVEDSGDVGFGIGNPAYQVHVLENTANETRAVNVDKDDNTTAATYGIYNSKTSNGTGFSYGTYNLANGVGNGRRYGTFNDISGTGTGRKYGTYNLITSTSAGNQYAIRNVMTAASGSAQAIATFNEVGTGTTGNIYGTYNGMRGNNSNQQRGVHNEFDTNVSATELTGVRNQLYQGSASSGIQGILNDIQNSSNSNIYGVRTEYTNDASGTGTKYGTYNLISGSAGGTHYGTYNQVSSVNGWAGYFLGRNYISERLSIGQTSNTEARLAVRTNSFGTNYHLDLVEQDADDGSRVRFTNAFETDNYWTIFGRADDTETDARFNIFFNAINGGGGGNVIVATGAGNVGIRRTPTTNDLEVNGTASKSAAGSWLANSDRRLKKNIKTIASKNALEKLLSLRGVTYEWNDDKTGIERPTEIQYGFIAQELMKVFPEKVTKDEQGFYQTAYGDYDALFVQAIKELNDKVKTLKQENATLKVKLHQLENFEARLEALEKNRYK